MSEVRLECPKVLDQNTGRDLLDSVSKQNGGADNVVLDFAKTERMDSRGGAWLIEIADRVQIDLRAGQEGLDADIDHHAAAAQGLHPAAQFDEIHVARIDFGLLSAS